MAISSLRAVENAAAVAVACRLGHAPRTILTEFSRIHSADIVLPLADGSTRGLRLRCVVRPDRERELLLLQRLGLTLPERLRRPSGTEM